MRNHLSFHAAYFDTDNGMTQHILYLLVHICCPGTMDRGEAKTFFRKKNRGRKGVNQFFEWRKGAQTFYDKFFQNPT